MLQRVTKYGIAPRHITAVIAVSRSTASRWLNQHERVRTEQNEPLARELYAAVLTAVRYEELPAPQAFKGRTLDVYLVNLLKKYMTGPGKELVRTD